MSNQYGQAVSIGLQLLSGAVETMIFSSAFHHHTVKGVDFDESLEHALTCLSKTKKRIPEFVKEQSK